MGFTAIIGTGTWGTAMAATLARAGRAPVLLGRDAVKVAELVRSRRHPQQAAIELPAGFIVTADPAMLAGAALVLWAVPTQFTAAEAARLAPHLPAGIPVMSLAKGLEQGSLRRVSEILGDALPGRPVGVLSGPCIAHEVLSGMPTCLVAAGPEAALAAASAEVHGRALRRYTSPDLVGVELAGALKNVMAIAAGICDGLELGDNLKAAVVTRGVAEMRRLGRAMGANDGTFAGMAGVGDLLTTSYSRHGRNRALGLALARGGRARDLLADSRTVAEGAWTCRAALDLGQRHGIELPITSEVDSVVWGDKPVRQALDSLLSRAPKEEDA
jgi:glycerol-3-phosphate dehydrogenase (NAD(P)+)